MLFDIESDYAERWNVADDHPQIVTELYGLVERFRADLGDYNRMGSGVRLFEPYDVRPARPVLVP
jgi:arylsulfatase